ncbi:hypothetical protein BCU83_18400 [Vibrio breoganii]|uniref:HlyD family secretion protein n=1 Tax=Vibrio breoganii TaxID=553239 RepID=UPI000C849668|nr:HlyD family efflux transporter periplasmic adaptor subunit [Vibrio breoganii]PMG84955.1 hypothetical protein BCU83_18400 [Vibrio breoganii]PMK50661.1 hypothetical protein BCU00_04300 [Vibrio breoganii]
MGAEKGEKILKIEFMLDKKKNPATEKGLKVLYGGTKRTGYRIRWFVLVAIVLFPALFGLGWIVKQQVFVVAPAVVSYNSLDLNVKTSGLINKVHFKTGDSVAAGIVLFELNDPVLDSEILFLEREIQVLRQILKQEDDSTLKLYRGAVTQSRNTLNEMEAIKRKFDAYYSKGEVSSDYSAVLSNYAAAESKLTNSMIELRLAELNLAKEKYSGDVANVIRALEKELNFKVELRESLQVKAPFDSTILDVAGKVGMQVGELDTVMTIAGKDATPHVIAYLDPKYVSSAKMGQPVEVKLPNGENYKAEVSTSVQLATKLPEQLAKPFEGKRALMRVSVEFIGSLPESYKLVEGMPVEVYF